MSNFKGEFMKEIKAIIQPFLADRVLDALHQLPEIPGISVSEVMGYGKRLRTDKPIAVNLTEVFGEKRIKLEIVVPDRLTDQVVDTISEAAHTGNPGDGKIFVVPVWDVRKIRTGESGEAAI